MPTRFAEAGRGLDEEHEPTLERERGVRCHHHVLRNWRAHDVQQYSVRLGGCALCSPVPVDVDLERRV